MVNSLEEMIIRPCQCGRYDPLTNTFGMTRQKGRQAHQGWDLQAPVGTPVRAIASGQLTYQKSKSYGNTLILEFSGSQGVLYAFYAHLNELCVHIPGQVRAGEIIATTGRTGNAGKIPKAEAHLHFEIRYIKNIEAGLGLLGRIDPGEVLGYSTYSCQNW